MNIKIVIGSLLIACLIIGCSSTDGIFGKTSKQVGKQANTIQKIEDKQSVVTENKVSQIADLSFGTGYALNKVTNKEPAVSVAKELNQRVETIAGLPTIDQQKAMIEMIENLVSNNVAGKMELQKKDNDIQALQMEETILVKQKQTEVDKLTELAKTTALQNDTTQQQLTSLNKFWGLNMVFTGARTFLTHVFWAVLVLLIIFIVLRVAAATNPIANLAFGIFQQIAALVIHGIEALIPNSIPIITQAKNDVLSVSNVVAQTIQQPTTTNTPIVTPVAVLAVTGSR